MVLSQKGLLGASAALLAFTGLAVNVFSGMQAVANPNSRQQRQTLVAQREGEITMVFSSRADSTDLQNKANAVAAFLSKETGMKINAQIGDDTAAVEALRANRADVAFLSTRPALKAEKLAGARFYLAEVRENYSGKHTYNSVFVVPANSPLTTQPTAKATLEQLRGKKIAFTSPTSGSGFIFPTSELVKLGLVPNRDGLENLFGRGNVTYGGNYSKALQAVLRNQAEVATVSEYAMFPPYITNQERQKLRVLYKIPGVPAHGIAIDDDLPPQVREKFIDAMLKLNQPANNYLLSALYNSTQLVRVDHNRHLKPMQDALQRVGVEP